MNCCSNTAQVADELAVVRSVYTEAINHDPAVTYIQTGNQIPGKPSLGSWLSYGLGSECDNLPAFVVMTPSWSAKRDAQALYQRLWGAGFLPTRHAGVSLRAKGDPVLYISDPPGVDRETRRTMLDALSELNSAEHKRIGDPEINTRIAQYEMAFRMHSSVPDLTNIAGETKATLDLYGPRGHHSRNFFPQLPAGPPIGGTRRAVHRNFPSRMGPSRQPHARSALAMPRRRSRLHGVGKRSGKKPKGMLDDTLVVWGGEFGRTVYCQGKLTKEDYGRDHHPRCFTMWMAGGGVKGGVVHGETDDFSYNVVKDPVHIRDINATILHCLGIDHSKLTYKFQGLDQKLTGVEQANPVKQILV